MCTQKGFIVISREIDGWQWLSEPTVFCLWIHILRLCNWKEEKFKGTVVPRGSFITSHAHLATISGLSIKQVRTALQKLKSTGEIEVRATNKWTQIFVINYRKYQDVPDDEGRPTANEGQSKGNQKANEGQSKGNNRTNKQVNNITNKEYIEGETPAKKHSKKQFVKPSIEEIRSYIVDNSLNVDADRFFDYYESNGWMVGKGHMKDWQATCRNWNRRNKPDQAHGNMVHLGMPNYYNEPIVEDVSPTSDESLDKINELLGQMKGDARDNAGKN